MIRVVLDTNVIVSALLGPLGPPARVFLLAISGSIQLCVSGNVYAEYEEVIRRPRLQRNEHVITSTLNAIREQGLWVRPLETIRACSDPDDDIFLECASAAQADYLVTGNLRHFPSSWAKTRIVTPRGFLDVLSGDTDPDQT
jgi:putative PIN family toxin of toxin-antitoxin system